VHDGSTAQNLNMVNGLFSGLWGQNAHPLQFAGPEIDPEPDGMTFSLEESSESGSTNLPSNWASHPSGIGYRRTGIHSGAPAGSSRPALGGGPVCKYSMPTGRRRRSMAR